MATTTAYIQALGNWSAASILLNKRRSASVVPVWRWLNCSVRYLLLVLENYTYEHSCRDRFCPFSFLSVLHTQCTSAQKFTDVMEVLNFSFCLTGNTPCFCFITLKRCTLLGSWVPPKDKRDLGMSLSCEPPLFVPPGPACARCST